MKVVGCGGKDPVIEFGASRAHLRVHQFVPMSLANGPGRRAVIWVQGCTLACEGCFNPATHSIRGGRSISCDELLARLIALGKEIEGLTISGGEPLQQRPAVHELLRRVKQETSLSVLLFTGYTWEEVQRFPDATSLLYGVDVLVAGRFDRRQRLVDSLRGSANKTVHFLTDRYSLADLSAVPPAEVVVTLDGEIEVSGIDPPRLSHALRGGPQDVI